MLLSNDTMSISLDAGRLTAAENKITGERFAVGDGAEYAVFDGTVTSDGIDVKWTARDGYFEKTVTFTAPADGTLEKICVFDPTFADAADVHFHDDRTIWHVPMCVFARHEKGGVFYGLEYPYWDAEREMIFSPWVTLKKGEIFVCERVFLGVYSFDGRTERSFGPYPCGGKLTYTDMFRPEKGGLAQHLPDNKLTDDLGMEEEVLDRGEIRAMRAFFREHLGREPLPDDGYFVWQNGWWAGLFNADTEAIDVLAAAGVHDIMTAVMYYGWANHPSCAPNYVTDALFDPLRFPDPAAVRAVQSKPSGEPAALHHDESADGAAKKAVGESTESEFCAPEEYEALVRYGERRGVHVSSFSTPDNSYSRYPEWIARNENGEPYRYFGTALSCPACAEYMDRHLETLSAIFEKYNPRIWPFDGRWMGYREITCGETVGEQPCFAENHGHAPGKSRYIEWKNIENFKRRLKERFPGTVLEHYYGMKRGGTWSLRYCSSDENVFECSCADDNRFQTWHNEVDRFRPTYMNYAPIFGKEHDLEYSMISAISTSEYAQLASAYYDLRDDPAKLAIFKKWREWAGENHRYLLDRENLFGCPGDVAVDGSAHIIDGEGWVFLFNTVDSEAAAHLVTSEIYGLADCEYEARVIYPGESVIAEENGAIDVTLAPHTACVLRLAKKGG